MNEIVKRIDNLEVKFSYQDELIRELNIIVADQQKNIDELKSALKELVHQSGASNEKSQKPPHY